MAPRLADRWERLTLVRKRFRTTVPWLRVPLNEMEDVEGEHNEHEPSTKFLKWNVCIIRAVYEAHGMKPKPSISQLQKQA